MGTSKNNPNARKGSAKQKTFEGKPVKPVKYIGARSTYIAAQFEDGKLVVDSTDRPLPFSDIH
jgi:hypothetical protein